MQWAFVEFIKKITEEEKVFLLVANETLQEKVRHLLEMGAVNHKKVFYILQRTNRSWMRDAGPIIVATR